MNIVAKKANQIYAENQETKRTLLEQIDLYETLFEDRQGMEVAYRRMHHINKLVREIERFSETKYNKRLKDVIAEIPDQIAKGKFS